MEVPGSFFRDSYFHYGDISDLERQSIIDLELSSGMRAQDYAVRIAEQQHLWNNFSGRRTGLFIHVVNDNFKTLVKEQPPEDIKDARDILIGYSKQFFAESDRGNWDAGGPYLTWILKVRRLANFTYRLREGSVEREYTSVSSSSDDVYSTEKFWQDIYMGSTDKNSFGTAFGQYVFGPKIETKDPNVLSDVVERLQDEKIEKVFAGSQLINIKSPEKIVRVGYDSFKAVIEEASEAGWKNAFALSRLLDTLTTRDIPLHFAIIALGNQVTHLLNTNNSNSNEVKLEKLNIYNLQHTAEAINRCCYLMFELGKKPDGGDPLNYVLTGQILGELFLTADRFLRQRP